MKIVIVTYEFPPYSGGIGSYSFQLAQALARRGHAVTVVTPNSLGSDSELFSRVEMKTFAGWSGFVLEPLLLWKVLVKSDADVTFITHAKGIRSASILSLFCDVSSLVPVLHGTEIREVSSFRGILGVLKRFMFKRMLLSVRGTIANTHHTARSLVASFGGVRNLEIMYPVVDEIYLNEPLTHADDQTNVLHLLTVARLEKGKGHDMVLSALSLLKRKSVKFKYTIVGKGSYEQSLRRFVGEAGLEAEVYFAGERRIPELIQYYDACDVFVMPSAIDSFGIVFLEAAARCKPVIAGGQGGGVEFISDGENGFILSNDSAEELAQILSLMAANPEKNHRMGMNGHNKVKAHFSSDVMVSVVEKLVNGSIIPPSRGE